MYLYCYKVKLPTDISSKRLLIVANSAWYIYNFRMSLIKALHQQGYEIYVLTPIDDYINFLNDNDYIHYLPLKHLTRKRLNIVKEALLIKELLGHYRSIQPDVVLHYTIKANLYGSMVASWLRIKSIVVIPGLGYTFTQSSKLKPLIKSLYRRILPYNEVVIFENHSDAKNFVAQGIISSEKAVVFKGCGVDTLHFSPMKARAKKEDRIFLFMGRLIREKGIEEFVSAARLVHKTYPDVQFWVIGHIDEDNPSAIPNDTFLSWIAPDYMHYKGFKDDVREIIREVDCVVLPSYYPEGIPRVLQEAMSMEKAIITADTDGCREALTDRVNGYLCAPRDPNSLAAAMVKLLQLSETDLEIMGKAGRVKAIAEFDESITIKEYLKYINMAAGVKSAYPFQKIEAS